MPYWNLSMSIFRALNFKRLQAPATSAVTHQRNSWGLRNPGWAVALPKNRKGCSRISLDSSPVGKRYCAIATASSGVPLKKLERKTSRNSRVRELPSRGSWAYGGIFTLEVLNHKVHTPF